VPKPDARAQGLLRWLADARRVDSVVVVTRVCREIADLTGVSQETQGQLHAAVQDAHAWLEKQDEVCRALFSGLEQAVTAQDIVQVRTLPLQSSPSAANCWSLVDRFKPLAEVHGGLRSAVLR